MPTRLYFPESTAADVSPAIASGWTYTSQLTRRKLAHIKGSSAITVGTRIGIFLQTDFAIDRQYTSDPMAAGIVFTGGTDLVQMQLMVREYATTDNVNLIYSAIRIFDQAGTTLRAELKPLNGYNTTNEFINNASHRNQQGFTGGNQVLDNSYTTQLGDRLVIEIGYGLFPQSGTTPEASAKWGENATDLPENNTQTSNGAGWIQFSNTITFINPATILTAAAAAFLLSGKAVIFSARRILLCNARSFVLTGSNTLFQYLKNLIASGTNFATSGTGTAFKKSQTLLANFATYVQTGSNTYFSFIKNLVAAAVSFSTQGTDTFFTRSQRLAAAAGTFIVSGSITIFSKTLILILDSADYLLTGSSSIFKQLKNLVATAGAFILQGFDAIFPPPPPVGNTPIDTDQLRIIAQYIANTPPPFYTSTQSFLNDLYTTGARPMELLQPTRFTQSLINPDYWTLQPQKGNDTREIAKVSISDSLNFAIINNTKPYEGLTLRQLEYSIDAVNPVGKMYANSKEIIAYMYRYNRVRQYVDDGYTQLQISNIFGWVSPTIIATYSTRQLYIHYNYIPPESYQVKDANNNSIIDADGTKITSQ